MTRHDTFLPPYGRMLLLALALSGCAGQTTHRQGIDLFVAGKHEEGLAKLEQASAEAPDNATFRQAYRNARQRVIQRLLGEAVRERGAKRMETAEAIYQRILIMDAGNAEALDGLAALAQEMQRATQQAETAQHAGKSDEPVMAPMLRASFRKPATLEFRDADLKQVLEALSVHSGLNFILDKDVPPINVTVLLRDVSVAEALELILTTHQLRHRVLGETTLLIYPDTASKLVDHQELVVRSFFLANAEAKQVATMLAAILKAKNVFADEKLNLLIMRDTPAMIQLAERLVATQDVAEPEVMLEVAVVEVSRSQLSNLGIRFPNQLSLSPLPSIGDVLTLRDLRNLDSGTIGASISPLTINLQDDADITNLLANPRIRTHNREKALIRIGDRVPVITTTATSTGFVSESVQYVDVGLKLEVEPTIYPNDEISIKLALEVSSVVKEIVSKAGTVSYQIGGRNAATVLRLKDGETQVLGGLINDDDRHNANRFPGLGRLPIIGRLFSREGNNNQKTELVLSITPRIVRSLTPPAQVPGKYWSGTENHPRLWTAPPAPSAAQDPQAPSVPPAP
ncbi:MAG: secretin N-terminal domain-containing protein [Rhodocyclaceae bacterium]|nr:secretin N-terminal domain-containing protein [Rhodocyclaceae bacterium]MDZ4213948.1 secretin N-terminal domain-containing protein [Rhodocyclaceae bacterium]